MVAAIWQFPGPVNLVVTFSMALIQTALLIHLIKKTKSKLPQTAILTSYIAIIFYSLYAINQFILSIYAIATRPATFNGYICYYMFFTPIYFLTGKIFTFIFYLARLYRIFNNTTFSYSKSCLRLFGVFIIIGYYASSSLFAYVALNGLNNSNISVIDEFAHCAEEIDYRSSTNILLTSISIMLNLIVDLLVTIITLRSALIYLP